MKNAIISVKNLDAGFDDTLILEDVSVDIYPNEITVILGGSGCGKTTLVKNIVRLSDPVSGSVEIFGKDTTEMDEDEFDEIISRVGMLFQNSALLNSLSVYDNISIPLEQHTDLPHHLRTRIIQKKLKLVHLSEAIFKLPSELSGGMRKRAALARAMALDPDILFCDEPSAGLDPLTSAALDELILNLKKQLNMTIIVVTHELASIHRIADRIIFLDKGKALFCGTLEEAKKTSIPEVQNFFKVGTF
jgi:phospholipid/cholesterol/gamma-HCH transport system ATP-binding protein